MFCINDIHMSDLDEDKKWSTFWSVIRGFICFLIFINVFLPIFFLFHQNLYKNLITNKKVQSWSSIYYVILFNFILFNFIYFISLNFFIISIPTNCNIIHKTFDKNFIHSLNNRIWKKRGKSIINTSCSHISFSRDKASFIPYILSSNSIHNKNKKVINNKFYCWNISSIK